MSQEQATKERPQEETATSGWNLIEMYAANAKADSFLGQQRYEHQTAEGFPASVRNFDGRPDITVTLASILGGRDVGYATINLTMAFNTTDDGCTLLKPVYYLKIEQFVPGATRTSSGVDVHTSQITTCKAHDLSPIWKQIVSDMSYDLIVEGLESGLRQALSGTRYELMMFGPGQEV